MKKKILIIVCVVLLVIVALGVWAVTQNNKADKFQAHTMINGVDCSGLTVDQATEKLAKEWNKREYTIVKEGKEIDRIKNLDFKYDIKDQVQKSLKPSAVKSIFTYYGFSDNEITVEMKIVKPTKRFLRQIKKLYLPVTGKKKVTKNAYVDMSTSAFKIVPEVYGNTMDRSKVREKIIADIERGTFQLDYEEKEFYKKPKILSDDPKLLKKQEYGKKYLSAKITYDLLYTQVIFTPAQLDEMITGKDGEILVDEDAVASYVATVAPSAEDAYNAAKGKYGWALEQDKSVNQLANALASGKDATVIASYTAGRTGSNQSGTCVEIDISEQHLWFYVDGDILVSTPIVTGDVAQNYDTPTGTYWIYNKKSPATLKGENRDGSKYASPVKYWMPFNGGIGLHDAPWKWEFGGQNYLTNGSHGCINMPADAARITYENIAVGTKVVVHP